MSKRLRNLIIPMVVLLLIDGGVLVYGTRNQKNVEIPEVQPVASPRQSAQDFIDQKCSENESNVGMTECVIELLDRTAAEREWKQRKLETAKHPQINKYNTIPEDNLAEEQVKIKKWRKDFEKMRDAWCEAKNTFLSGSGTPYSIAVCELGFELTAINDLNDICYETILKEVDRSEGIPDFEPTQTDIDVLVKTNATIRGCVWAGETVCDE